MQNAKKGLRTERTPWIYDQRGSPGLPLGLLVGTLISITFQLSAFNHFLWSLLFVSASSHVLYCVANRQEAFVKYILAAETGLGLAQSNAAHLCEVHICCLSGFKTFCP